MQQNKCNSTCILNKIHRTQFNHIKNYTEINSKIKSRSGLKVVPSSIPASGTFATIEYQDEKKIIFPTDQCCDSGCSRKGLDEHPYPPPQGARSESDSKLKSAHKSPETKNDSESYSVNNTSSRPVV